MKQLVLIFIGGGLGSVSRFIISKPLNHMQHIPYGTLLVNILGSLIIGITLGVAYKNAMFSQQYATLIATGFCGGFTTFSAFAFENQSLLKSGDFTTFIVYTMASIAFSILAVILGVYIAKTLC